MSQTQMQLTQPECPDLMALFGDRFKIQFDEACSVRNVPRDKLDSWMMQLPCSGGITIYPHGRTILAVEVDYHPGIARQLRGLGLAVHQRGDCEWTFLFDVADFDAVARIVRPYRRPRLSAEERARRRGRMTRLRSGSL